MSGVVRTGGAGCCVLLRKFCAVCALSACVTRFQVHNASMLVLFHYVRDPRFKNRAVPLTN